ncbi:MAG: tail length tape measure protein [Puniceicoccaceae bacterium 5H]|nr:MAG: tail length tape measure protein [Puniceicoccaceae bacterium 5H]
MKLIDGFSSVADKISVSIEKLVDVTDRLDKSSKGVGDGQRKAATALRETGAAAEKNAKQLERSANQALELARAQATGAAAEGKYKEAVDLLNQALDKSAASAVRKQRATNQLQAITRSMAKAEAEAAEAARKQEIEQLKVAAAEEKARIEAERAASQSLALARAEASGAAAAGDYGRAVRILGEALEGSAASAVQKQQATNQMQTAMRRLSDEMAKNAKETNENRSMLDHLGDMMDRVRRKAAELRRGGVAALNRGFASMRNLIFGVVGAMTIFLGIGGIGGLITKGVDAVETMDRYNFTLKAVTGSQALASEEFLYAQREADRLGVAISSAAGSYSKLLAAGKPAGLQMAEIREIFEATSEAGTVLGLSNETLEGTLYAIQQIMNKGKLSAEELTQQLGERLPGANALAAEAMGMTTAELAKQMELGNVYSNEFLPKFAATLRKYYGDEVGDAADRFARHLTRMQNRITYVTDRIARPITESLIPVLREVNEWLDQGLESGKFERLGYQIGGFVLLVKQEWAAGRVDDLIALTLEAGIESGMNAAGRTMESQFGHTVKKGLLKANLVMLKEFAQAFSDSISFVAMNTTAYLVAAFEAAADRIATYFENRFTRLGQYFKGAGEMIAKGQIPGARSFSEVADAGAPADYQPRQARSYDEIMQEIRVDTVGNADARRGWLEDYFGGLSAGLDSANQVDGKSATERFGEEVAKLSAALEKNSASLEKTSTGEPNSATGGTGSSGRALSNAELLAAAKLQGYQPSGRDEGGFVKKNPSRLEESRARLEGQPVFDSTDGQNFTPTGDSIGGLTDPMDHFQSASEGMLGALYEIQAAFGSIGDAVYDLTDGAFDAMGSSIEDMLNGTQNLSSAWSDYGKSIRKVASREIAEWVQARIAALTRVTLTKLGLMRTESAAKDAETAKEQMRGMTEAAAWTPAAIIKSIASFGIALAFGALAMVLIGSLIGGMGGGSMPAEPAVGATNPYDGSTTSVQTPGFADGVVAFDGRGGPRDDANMVRMSRGESMITAAATNLFAPALRAMNAGGSRGSVIAAIGGAAPVVASPSATSTTANNRGGEQRNIPIYLIRDEADMRQAIRRDGPGVMIDLMRDYGASLSI